uniref:Uncharacterized protein n=1 Tax=Ditylenchus dipsaci TaxID=166011 RepID=A0A915DZ31_9BILA
MDSQTSKGGRQFAFHHFPSSNPNRQRQTSRADHYYAPMDQQNSSFRPIYDSPPPPNSGGRQSVPLVHQSGTGAYHLLSSSHPTQKQHPQFSHQQQQHYFFQSPPVVQPSDHQQQQTIGLNGGGKSRGVNVKQPPPAYSQQPRRPNTVLGEPSFGDSSQQSSNNQNRRESRRQVVPLHIKNPFLYPEEEPTASTAPRVYHRTLSLPIHQPDTAKRSNTLPHDNFLLDLLEDEFDKMSKTTPNWKNSFSAMRDRFGQQPSGIQDALIEDFGNGAKKMPFGGINGRQTPKTPAATNSLLKSAINNASIVSSPKKELGNFWMETVRTAERLEQLQEAVEQAEEQLQRPPTSSGNSLSQTSRLNKGDGMMASNGSATYPYRRSGVESVAARRNNYLRETFRSQSPVSVTANGSNYSGRSTPTFSTNPRALSVDYSASSLLNNLLSNGSEHGSPAPNFSLLDNAVAEISNGRRSPMNNGNRNGCGRFPTAFPLAEDSHKSSSKTRSNQQYEPTYSPRPANSFLHPNQSYKQAHSPSPDNLSETSQNSLSLLPHPRPKHNITQQLINAGIASNFQYNNTGTSSSTSHTLGRQSPNFPSPNKKHSVAMRISALEKSRPSTATTSNNNSNLLQFSLAFNSQQSKDSQSSSAPMSPKSTVYRTKPVIHFDMESSSSSNRFKFPSPAHINNNNKVGVL